MTSEKNPKSRSTLWLILAGAGGIGLLFLVCACVAILFFFAQNRATAIRPPVLLEDGAIFPTDTPRVLPSIIPSAGATHSPASTPRPGSTPALDATQMYQHFGPQITAARGALDKGNNDVCIQEYDRLVAQMPNWAIGYYNRSVCKLGAANKLHDRSLFKGKVQEAIIDIDKAIEVKPDYGSAYVQRGFEYDSLSDVLDNPSDYRAAIKIALENIKTGIVIGDLHPTSPLYVTRLLNALNQCQDGLQEVVRVGPIDKWGQMQTSYFSFKATSHVCLGDYTTAIDTLKEGEQYGPCCDAVKIKTEALIGLGKMSEAYQTVDQDIQTTPDYGGYRYYLRALIHYDQGEFDQARQDLLVGSGNVWYEGGLHAYLQGMLALRDGDQKTGTEWIHYAAMTYQTHEGLWLKKRIDQQLTKLNIQYISPTPEIHWEITPLPPLAITIVP